MKKIIYVLKSIFQILVTSEYNNGMTYFPEVSTRKGKLVIIEEQIKHFFKYHSINKFYFLYGFDRNGFRNEDEYVDYEEFRNVRERLIRQQNAPIAILRDKFLFGIVANSLGIKTANNIGFCKGCKLYLLREKKEVDLVSYLHNEEIDVFFKLINGECADGVFRLKSKNGRILLNDKVVADEILLDRVKGSTFILQELVIQCKELENLYPSSVNTIRVETIYDRKSGNIELLPPLLRVGTRGNNVDNWAVGGLAVMIDMEKKCLGKYGFYKPHFGTKESKHPDTGIVFEGYKIPFLSEAINMAKEFHSFFPAIHSIGWDIAITDDGPCFIEGNDNWEISLVQICSHGLNKEFRKYFN